MAPSVPPVAVRSREESLLLGRRVEARESIDDADDGQSSFTFWGENSIKNSRNASLVDDVDGREGVRKSGDPHGRAGHRADPDEEASLADPREEFS